MDALRSKVTFSNCKISRISLGNLLDKGWVSQQEKSGIFIKFEQSARIEIKDKTLLDFNDPIISEARTVIQGGCTGEKISFQNSTLVCRSCVIKSDTFHAYNSVFNVTSLTFQGGKVWLTALRGLGNFTSTAMTNSVRNSNFTTPLSTKGFRTQPCSKIIENCDRRSKDCIDNHPGGGGVWCSCPYGYANSTNITLPWGDDVRISAAPEDGSACNWENILCLRGTVHQRETGWEACEMCKGENKQYSLSNTKCHDCPRGGNCSLGGSKIQVTSNGGFWQGMPYLRNCISDSTYAWLKERRVPIIVHHAPLNVTKSAPCHNQSSPMYKDSSCPFIVSSPDSLIDQQGGRATIHACPGGTAACPGTCHRLASPRSGPPMFRPPLFTPPELRPLQ